ncbi:hypothetical protein [Moellerella wisconsensis]|uniref:Uncharacterized protein n=1 Tax=Moellerella wisconsensis ATCC 35017 TaxID=1354267 RepID=A0A0N0Z930_9GAMM|nr:hypothetical protein [Moellerella wisconsensis]KPD02217.1 hypothetical protein M992_2211 [Moellerella wisconsensis ATCC 35017]VFS53870.1 Uncharacterised protein [Moellerella wisconsensis]
MKKIILLTSSLIGGTVIIFLGAVFLFNQPAKSNNIQSDNAVSYLKQGIAVILPESAYIMLSQWGQDNSACEILGNNLDSFSDYLQANTAIVHIKGMNGLDEQLELIRQRIEQMPVKMKRNACQHEMAKLEGLKSVFFLEDHKL